MHQKEQKPLTGSWGDAYAEKWTVSSKGGGSTSLQRFPKDRTDAISRGRKLRTYGLLG